MTTKTTKTTKTTTKEEEKKNCTKMDSPKKSIFIDALQQHKRAEHMLNIRVFRTMSSSHCFNYMEFSGKKNNPSAGECNSDTMLSQQDKIQ